MLLSVLMCVYKERSSVLKESIESVLNQTYSDFEFVIVGDTPESDRKRVFGIVEEYAKNDRRIIFVSNEENIGLTKSLNVGLKYCSGKYVARMDADDISLPARFEKQIAFMEENSQILASSTWYEEFIEDCAQRIIRTKSDPKYLRVNVLSNCIMSHPASMFRRIIDNEEVRYDERFAYAQDYALWIWILQRGDLSIVEEVLLRYRITDNQISNSKKNEQQNCAKAIQRLAFEELYKFPRNEPFLNVMSEYTIYHNCKIPENLMRKAFCNFFAQIKMTKKNREAVEFLIQLYIKYGVISFKKRIYHLIYDIANKNVKILVSFEYEYFYKKVLSLICRLRKR